MCLFTLLCAATGIAATDDELGAFLAVAGLPPVSLARARHTLDDNEINSTIFLQGFWLSARVGEKILRLRRAEGATSQCMVATLLIAGG